MANFEGNYEVIFKLDEFSETRKAQFIEFIKKWRAEHPLGNDNWIENYDFESNRSLLWGFNSPENIEDLHAFLTDAAIAYPELEATGYGDGADVATGSWEIKYKFSLNNGVLNWDANEWSQEKEAEKTIEAAADKPVSSGFKLSLKEIFPKLDESLPNGLIIENGILKGFNTDYYKFLGDDSYDGFYFPPEVESFDENFDIFTDNYEWTVKDFVITTNFKEIPQGVHNSFEIRGFENFYIVDADTKETVFYSNKFCIPETVSSGDMSLYELKTFCNFANAYETDPDKAIHNRRYGIAVDSMNDQQEKSKGKEKNRDKSKAHKDNQNQKSHEFKTVTSDKPSKPIKQATEEEKQSAADTVKKAAKKVKTIEFEGKTFVFDGRGTINGVYYAEFKTDDPAITKVREKGGIVKKDITSKTDYFVINTKDKSIWEKYRVRDAAKQLEKRNSLIIIKLTDLLKILDE